MLQPPTFAAVLGLQKYDSNRFRSDERSINSKKWPSIFSTEAGEAALTVGTIFLRNSERNESDGEAVAHSRGSNKDFEVVALVALT